MGEHRINEVSVQQSELASRTMNFVFCRQHKSTLNNIALILSSVRRTYMSLGVLILRLNFKNIISHICSVPVPDRTTVSSIFGFGKFSRFSPSFLYIGLVLSRHLYSFTFRTGERAFLVCSWDTRQTAFIFFLISDHVSVDGL